MPLVQVRLTDGVRYRGHGKDVYKRQVLDKDAQPALESSAGYNQFLIGAPHYLLLMSAPHSYAAINAGYMMEDLVLKLTELDLSLIHI